MKKSKIFLTVAALFVSASVSFSEIKMPRIFGDHMMVQREEPVNVWGMADAGAKVEVDFLRAKVSTKAGRTPLVCALEADESKRATANNEDF
ncbi:MAG: hypothetical protein ACLUKN_08810 [Bacilli bacterium]